MTKIYFDTEFTGLHKNTTLISIGLISECGKTFYAELNDFDETQLNDWLKENVIANLKFEKPKEGEDEYYVATRDTNNIIPNDLYKSYSIELRGNIRVVEYELRTWFRQFDKIEMWSDCLSYDWVLFNDIFGNAFTIPDNIYYIPFDICTTFKEKGIDPDISREEFAAMTNNSQKHNSLWDAKVIKKCHELLIK